MIIKNFQTVPSFVSHAHLFVSIMNSHLSEDKNKKIAISKSFFTNKALIVPIELANEDYITLEDFLVKFDIRMKAEFVYREEIAQLRDNICNEYNKLCNAATNKDFIRFIRDQRQKVIDTLIDETAIEGKTIAEEFFNKIMNGFEEEALNLKEFSEIVHKVLWKPLIAPFPIGVEEMLRELIEGLEYESSTDKIKHATNLLVEHIKNHMKVNEIKDDEYNSSTELRIALEEMCKRRKICNVVLYDVFKNENIIEEFIDKCVESVKIKLTSKKFLEQDIKIIYEDLELSGPIEGNDFDKLFDKFSTKINALKIELGKGSLKNYNKIKKRLPKLIELKCLDIDLQNNSVGDTEAALILAGLKGLTKIIILNLNLCNNNIEDKGVETLSAALEQLPNISILNLNLGENNINEKGAKALSIGLKHLKSVVAMDLIIAGNFIKDEGVIALSEGLKELDNILTLDLLLGGNNIGDKGVIGLSAGLKELKKLSTLSLNLSWGHIEAEGVKALLAGLKELTNISTLDLNLRENNIGEDGVAVLSTGLRQLSNIILLTLHLSGYKIETENPTLLQEFADAYPNYKISF